MQKEFGQRLFDQVCRIVPERKNDGTILTDTPHHRYENRDAILHEYGGGPFCRFRGPTNSSPPGVYVITVDGDPKYVGECEDLLRRFNAGYGNISPRNCFKKGQSTNCKINHLILESARANAQIDLWFRLEFDPKRVEFELIARIRPIWNGKFRLLENGAPESECSIERDASSDSDYRSQLLTSNAEKILEVILETPNLCDDCLSAKTRIRPRQQANQICRTLELKNLIHRFVGKCEACGGIKKTNSPPRKRS